MTAASSTPAAPAPEPTGAQPVAWMWQHEETGMTGFVQHAPEEELRQWERMNRPRKIVAPLYARSAPAVPPEMTPGDIRKAGKNYGLVFTALDIRIARAIIAERDKAWTLRERGSLHTPQSAALLELKPDENRDRKRNQDPDRADNEQCASGRRAEVHPGGAESGACSGDGEAIFAKIEEEQRRRAEAMPTERDAIRVMFDAYQRLKELGWREGRSMPTGQGRFAGIASGSTGIHAYTAEKPNSPLAPTLYTIFDGDLWPTYQAPALFRPWADTDVQPNYRPTYLGMVDEGEARHD